MMRAVLTAVAAVGVGAARAAQAHCGMIIPSDPMVSQEGGRSVSLTLSSSHPFEGEGMALDPPVAFGVTSGGETTDLLGALEEATVMGGPGFALEHPLGRPGAYVFGMEPQPSLEPA